MNSNKLSSYTKSLISHAADTESDRELDLLVRVNPSISPADAEAVIRELGGRVRTHSGDVLSLSLPFQQLDALTQLDSVIYVEASEPMYPESPPEDTGE